MLHDFTGAHQCLNLNVPMQDICLSMRVPCHLPPSLGIRRALLHRRSMSARTRHSSVKQNHAPALGLIATFRRSNSRRVMRETQGAVTNNRKWMRRLNQNDGAAQRVEEGRQAASLANGGQPRAQQAPALQAPQAQACAAVTCASYSSTTGCCPSNRVSFCFISHMLFCPTSDSVCVVCVG